MNERYRVQYWSPTLRTWTPFSAAVSCTRLTDAKTELQHWERVRPEYRFRLVRQSPTSGDWVVVKP